MSNKTGQVYCVQLGTLKWTYSTALEAWNSNEALQVRKSYTLLQIENVVTGIRNYEEFAKKLDEGATLGFHALRVYKTDECEV
ncbi:hypothetical protein [Clostridium beijerinckii]|uniref:Uncharacterized protein n=1 Tax=Clostridium beijerinckii TaxID=1520 RepID=A0AAW3W6Y0_CLOBE|nr:hypothetical protein [Clostridium beijerinckii]MBC2457168.1 hypothetical protein [Clostridium beijerinckii]MBC2474224.1 hypothetical protein [Clostridium beijerinckii]NOV58677.1 hypothetical protein [Clostridium beijerinckii]NOV71938.1 hypothetical protein [Clostridium beijerinckii]NOW32032.1 hypothetical protein [Clostridium beijerinckii]